MPDEDMEMGIDFAHPGLVEDIDIDLDFPIGQVDSDMVLEDFDRDLNSDPRDELMVEGDDLPYGMADAIDIDHNASASAANDIDIELGHEVGSLWQGTLPAENDNSTVEIDYLDEAGVEQMEDDESDIHTGGWLQPAGSQHTNAIGDSNTTSADLSLGPLQTNGDVPPEALAATHEESSEHLERSLGDVEGTQLSVLEHLPQEAPTQEGQSSAGAYEHFEDLPNTEQSEPQIGHVDSDAVAQKLGFDPEEEEPSRLQEAGQPAEEAVHTPAEESKPPHTSTRLDSSEGVVGTGLDEDGGADEHEDRDKDDGEDEEEHLDAEEDEDNAYNHEVDLPQPNGDQPADAVDASEYQGGESYVEATNDEAQAHETSFHPESPDLEQSYSQSVGSDSGDDVDGEASNPRGDVVNTATPSVGAGSRDDPIKLADHYGVYISYGCTDYNLFAKDENDDPNQYFLSDKTALDLSLLRFLASLREVISEEVSPLDELVMHVDGLGLEFSESTSPDFLDKFTFGDLVVLYDKLVQNEEAELSPPIYTYLTIRPNCNQRMRALTESANAGRGLSEVALYREPSNIEGDGASNADSPETDISVADDYNGYTDDDQLDVHEDLSPGDSGSDDAGESPSPVTAEAQLDPSEQNVGFDEFEKESSGDGGNGDAGSDDNSDKNDENDDSDHFDSVDTLDDGEAISIFGQDQTTNEASTSLPQETSASTLEAHRATQETGASEAQASTAHPSLDVPNSQTTSATATLDGEAEDEIDYNSDEDNEGNEGGHDATGEAVSNGEPSATVPDAKASVDDEITWESDNEEKEDQAKNASPKDTVQVSPVSRKRAQSEALGDTEDENDNKRRRS